jgi:hypothetical protein
LSKPNTTGVIEIPGCRRYTICKYCPHLDIEEACKKAQIVTECVVQQLETPEDITDLLKTYTKAVAEKPGKKID